MKANSRVEALFSAANKAKACAYAPYSKFFVGAAVSDEQGRVFAGCNVENSSYGATMCAERNAIGAMVAAGGHRFTEIVVVTNLNEGTPPCGICRQVLAEFAQDPENVRVHVAGPEGITRTFTLKELLPEAFGKAHLQSSKQ